MKVAVAGGSGFIGRHVVAALHRAGHAVVVLSRTRRDETTAHVAVDLARDEVPAGALAGCDAVVNLIGIKAGTADAFRGAHVEAVRRLVDAARTAGIDRLVHVSVVDPGDARTDYAVTKRAGEAVAAESGLQTTILRPALVVGPGDDALRNAIRLVRAAPIFVAPRPKPGRLAVVDVQDVATAVVRTLSRPVTIGRTYDLVGADRITLAALARRVGSALHLPVVTVTVPAPLMRPAAAIFERFGGDLVTRSQLDMIVRGLDGDGSAAARDLQLQPRPLSDARVRDVARTVAPFVSVRIWPSLRHRAFARLAARARPALAWFLPLALAAMLIAPWLLPSVWGRMAAVEAILATLALVAVPLPWRRILRPRAWHVPVGLAAASVMYLGGALVFAGLGAVWPSAVDQTRTVLAWTDEIPGAVQLPALVFIVAAEDIVWRAAVTWPLAARAGPVVAALGAASAFALGHVTSGPPVLWVAALVAGFAWSLLLLRVRSLWPVVICHASWDIAVAYVRPYV